MLGGSEAELVGPKGTRGGNVSGIPFCVTKAGNGVTVSGTETPMETEGTKLGLPETLVGSETCVVGTTETPNGGVPGTS